MGLRNGIIYRKWWGGNRTRGEGVCVTGLVSGKTLGGVFVFEIKHRGGKSKGGVFPHATPARY